MKYIFLTPQARCGFFDTNVDGETLPPFAVAVSETEWVQCLTYSDKYTITDGTLTIKPEWIAPVSTPPDWQGLTRELRGSSLFAKVYAAAKTDLAVNVAYTLILATLNSVSPVEADLLFAVSEVVAAMGSLLSEEDLVQAEALFGEHGFAIALA